MSGVHNHEPMKPDFMGKNGFVWWQGVVEDIYDPLRLGRVRVRVLGWHTDDKTEIPTESLPWAAVMMPANNPFVSGKGWSPNGLLQGSWVIGFYRDGLNGQEPVVMGTIGGINMIKVPVPSVLQMPFGWTNEYVAAAMKSTENEIKALVNKTRDDTGLKPNQLPKNPAVDTEKGFSDPEGIYPMISRMGEADTNRLARGENIAYTIVNKKNSSRVSTETAIAGYWAEPVSAYAAQYPFNTVYESQAGHVIEYDDTPGAERLHWYHCSGTFNEIHPKGSEVHKVVGNAWDITLNDKMIYVKGNASFNAGKTLKIMMGKDLDIEVAGDAKMYIKGNMTTDVGGNYLQKVKGTHTTVSEGAMVIIAPRIDLNPEGESPSALDTLMSKARSFINGLIESLSPPDAKVVDNTPVAPQQPTPQDFKKPDPVEPEPATTPPAVDKPVCPTEDEIMKKFGVDQETAFLLEGYSEKQINKILNSARSGNAREWRNEPDGRFEMVSKAINFLSTYDESIKIPEC